MFIQEIKITNFKSFYGESCIKLSKNKTFIIGKNGSGKSNLLSALNLLISPKELTSKEIELLIYENTDSVAEIEGVFDNYDHLFPSSDIFVLKRCLSLSKDEIFLNNLNVTHKEIQNMFETSGISNLFTGVKEDIKGKEGMDYGKNIMTPSFINSSFIFIPQNTINRISSLSPKNLYVLLQEVSGTLLYEEDKEIINSLVNSAESTKRKIMDFYKTLKTRVSQLKKQRDSLREWEDLEKQKKAIEYKLFKIEIENIDCEINEIENTCNSKNSNIDKKFDEESDSNEENDSSYKIRMLREQIEKLTKKKENVCNKIDVLKNEVSNLFPNQNEIEKLEKQKNVCKSISDELNSLISKKEKIQNKIFKTNSSIDSLKKEEEKTLFELKVMEYESDFIKRFDFSESEVEIRKTQEKLKIKEKELENLQNKENSENEIIPQNLRELSLSDYNMLIDKRKASWREQQKIKESIKQHQENLALAQKKAYLSSLSYTSYLETKNHEGILGCVFELIDVPEHLYTAFEAVCGSSIFNVVCENDTVATNLIPNLHHSLTFIPLNRINFENKIKKIENAVSLSSLFKFEEKYQNMVMLVTKGCYLVPDVETGINISKLYNVNTVTKEGDFVSRKGAVTCGNTSKGFFKEIRNEITFIENMKIELKKIEDDILLLNEKIEYLDAKSKKEDTPKEVNHNSALQLHISFMRKKLEILKKGITSNFIRMHKNELSCLKDKNINIKKFMHEKNEEMKKLEQFNEKNNILISYKYKIKEIFEMKEEERDLQIGIDMLRNKIKKKMENIYFINKKTETGNMEKEKLFIRKNILIEKKMNFNNKIREILLTEEIVDTDLNTESKEFLYQELTSLNEKIKKFSSVNKRAISLYNTCSEQTENICKRIQELDIGKQEIHKLLHKLNEKKDEAIQITFDLLKHNFSNFYFRLFSGHGTLFLSNNEMRIVTDIGENVFSGGQKTLLSLALIFSIQKIQPSPCYFFDEIDANLDLHGRNRVSDVLKEIKDTQFIFTTFREDMLEIGDKYYGVLFTEKKSLISEISKNTAKEFLNENINNE